jgi:hypothetical protein
MDDGTAALMAELLGLDGFRVLAAADAAGELKLLAETTGHLVGCPSCGRWRDRTTAAAQPGSGTPRSRGGRWCGSESRPGRSATTTCARRCTGCNRTLLRFRDAGAR